MNKFRKKCYELVLGYIVLILGHCTNQPATALLCHQRKRNQIKANERAEIKASQE